MTDAHAHLDALEDADAAVERAREAGVGRIVTIGTGIGSCRAALTLAGAHDGVYAALGIDPHQAGTREALRVGELRELFGDPKAEALRQAAAAVPADRILAETDSPYLAPQPVRGRPNEPAHVVHTVVALARARGEDPAELAARIDANATAAFRLP